MNGETVVLNGRQNTLSAIIVAISIISAIAGLGAAIGQYLNASINPLNKTTDFLQHELDKNDDVDKESIRDRLDIHSRIATIEKTFAEVETQFKNLDERTHRMEDSQTQAVNGLDKRLVTISDQSIGLTTMIARMDTKFVEIETQFKNLDNMFKRDEDARRREADLATSRLESEIEQIRRSIDQVSVLKARSQDFPTPPQRPLQ